MEQGLCLVISGQQEKRGPAACWVSSKTKDSQLAINNKPSIAQCATPSLPVRKAFPWGNKQHSDAFGYHQFKVPSEPSKDII